MNHKEIPLSRGFVTIVDDADYDWLMIMLPLNITANLRG